MNPPPRPTPRSIPRPVPPTSTWLKETRIGRTVAFLGGVRLAVPLLVLTAIALAWATWIESTQTAQIAKDVVYGSWWFSALMVMLCVTLILAVVSRYPWRKKHTGFMLVHAGLVLLVVGGFISLYGRVEGNITLAEGTTSSQIETDQRQISLLGHDKGKFNVTEAAVLAPTLELAGTAFKVVARWPNCSEETYVANDGVRPLQAVEISFNPKDTQGIWIGQTDKEDPSAVLGGFQIHVMAAGKKWTPLALPVVSLASVDEHAGHNHGPSQPATSQPATSQPATSPPASGDACCPPETPTSSPASVSSGVAASQPAESHQHAAGKNCCPTEPYFQLGDQKIKLTTEGQILAGTWRVKQILRLSYAMVGKNGLMESPSRSRANPAIQVIVEDGKGNIERHASFSQYPSLVSVRQMAGTEKSGLKLIQPKSQSNAKQASTPVISQPATSQPATSQPTTAPAPEAQATTIRERLVFETTKAGLTVIHQTADDKMTRQTLTGPFPYQVKLGQRTLKIYQNFANARSATRWQAAPAEDANRPLVVLETQVDGKTQRLQLPWKQAVPFTVKGKMHFLRYESATYPVPFTLRLEDFRQKDYPGSQMAMAYESDVSVQYASDGEWHPQRIWMNHPLEHEGWKVYQSGFVGDNVSVFSVMNDPGLTWTYLGCLILSCGILVTFYSTALSAGHPGIPRLSLPQSPPEPTEQKDTSNMSKDKNDSDDTPSSGTSGSGGASGGVSGGGPSSGGTAGGAVLILFLGLFVSSMAKAAGTTAPWQETVRQIAIQEDGRTMPLDTFAQSLAVQLTGRSHWSKDRGPEAFAGRDRIALLCDLIFDPFRLIDRPLIAVDNRPFKKRVGLTPTQNFFSAKTLAQNKGVRELITQFQRHRQKDSKAQPDKMEKIALGVQASLGILSDFAQSRPLRLVPDAKATDGSFLPVSLEHASPQTEQVRKAMVAFGELYRQGASEAELDVAAKAWIDAIHQEGAMPVSVQKRVRSEVFYNHHRPWQMTAVALGLSLVLLGLGRLCGLKIIVWLAYLAMAWGIGEQLLGLSLRVYILQRAPVSNTYESLIWMGLMAMLVGGIAQCFNRKGWYLFGSVVAAELCVLFAMLVPLESQTTALPPVLRSNYWLIIHVLVIVASYGILGLSAVLGHVYLIYHVLLGKGDPSDLKGNRLGNPLITQVYRSMQVGLFLLTVGTILGGVWAADSWGRFWGWDPKETWALISIILYFALLHARFVDWIYDFGLAVGAVMGMVAIVWTFYGVNYVMASGLHSYGFGSGGEVWVGLWALAEILLVVVCLFRKPKLTRLPVVGS